MLSRLALACLLVALPVEHASAGVKVHATCASELASDPVHVRTLRDEVSRALASTPVTPRYTLDISLVKLGAKLSGRQVEVHAEVRALLSDEHGRARWQTTSRATVRGPARDRASIERDAIGAAAREIASSVRAHYR